MKQSRQRGRVVTLADVIRSGSFFAPMAQWVSLAAAVSKSDFDDEVRRTKAWEFKLFKALSIEPDNYDALAPVMKRHGLKQRRGESAEAFCKRVFCRRLPSWNKPSAAAL